MALFRTANLRQENGFTLVEVVAATFILAVTLTALIALYQESLGLSAGAGNVARATAFAQAKIEELRGKNFADLKNAIGQSAPEKSPDGVYTREVTIIQETPDKKLLRIRVLVRWQDDLGEQKVSLTTLLADTGNGG